MRPVPLFIGIGSLAVSVAALRRAFADDGSVEGLSYSDAPQLLGPKSEVHSVRNIDERLSHIIKMIQKSRTDGWLREYTVRHISRKCGKKWCVPEKDYMAEVRDVFEHVRSRDPSSDGAVRYVRDAYGVDQFQSAKRTLQWGGGDCDDYTILLGAMLQQIGYPIKCRVIQTNGNSDWNHIYLVVGIPPSGPTRWVVLDGSVSKGLGWEAPKSIIKRVRDFEVP